MIAQALCAAALLATAGCAVVDSFSDRAIDYNLQAESTTDRDILLNVLRAAHSEPMQFTDFTTVTGLATASGTLAFALPFGADALSSYTASPSATLSGGPNFTVANLNTQEFYNGILTPLSMKTIALYMKEGPPKAVVLTLLIDAIDIVTQSTGDKPFSTADHIFNNANSRQYPIFQNNINALLAAGLDVERVESVTRVGAPLLDSDMADLKGIDALVKDSLVITKYDVRKKDGTLNTDSGLTQSELTALRSDHFYLIEKHEESFRFCFAIPASAKDLATKPISIGHGGTANQTITITPKMLCGAPQKDQGAQDGSSIGTSKDSKTKTTTQFFLRPRSVASVFFYLGEIARNELGIDGGDSFPHMVTIAQPGHDLQGGVKLQQVPLFTVTRGEVPAASASVRYLGKTYSIPARGVADDRSGEVMEIVTELLALNKSAKDLPAPSVIPVVR